MVESTFQLARGIGPARERRLWCDGIARWSDLPAAPATAARLSPAFDRALRAAVDAAAAAFAARDADRLAALVPARERWRLFAAFGDDAAYLDIETSDDVVGFAGISAIGISRRARPDAAFSPVAISRVPRARGRLDDARDLQRAVVRRADPAARAFPSWRPPVGHVDLRHVLERLGHGGGLKSIERRLGALGLARPAAPRGLDGWDTGWLFRRGRDGDRAALRLFAEYNLFDTIHLRTLMAYAYNELVAAEARQAPALRAAARPVDVPGRGDVLYDVSKILLAL